MREDHGKMQSFIFSSYNIDMYYNILKHTESSYTAVAQSLEHHLAHQFYTAGVGPFLAARPDFGAGRN